MPLEGKRGVKLHRHFASTYSSSYFRRTPKMGSTYGAAETRGARHRREVGARYGGMQRLLALHLGSGLQPAARVTRPRRSEHDARETLQSRQELKIPKSALVKALGVEERRISGRRLQVTCDARSKRLLHVPHELVTR